MCLIINYGHHRHWPTRKLPTPSVRPLGLDVRSRGGKIRGEIFFKVVTNSSLFFFQETSYFSCQTHLRESFISWREKVIWLFYLLSQASWKSSSHPRGRSYLWLPLRIFRMDRITPAKPLYASSTHEMVPSWLVWVAVTNIYRNQVSGRDLVVTYVEISSNLVNVYSLWYPCILCAYLCTCNDNIWFAQKRKGAIITRLSVCFWSLISSNSLTFSIFKNITS